MFDRAAPRSYGRIGSLRAAAALVLGRPIGGIVIRTRRGRATIRFMLARRAAMRALPGGVVGIGVPVMSVMSAMPAAFAAATAVAERSVLRRDEQEGEQDSCEHSEQDHLDGRSRHRNRTCRHALHRTCRRLGAEVPATSKSKWEIKPAASSRFPASSRCAGARIVAVGSSGANGVHSPSHRPVVPSSASHTVGSAMDPS